MAQPRTRTHTQSSPTRRPQRPARHGRHDGAVSSSGCRSRTTRSGPSTPTAITFGYFIDWCAARGVTQPAEVTKPIIERYQRLHVPLPQDERRPPELPQPARPRWWRSAAGSSWLARNNHILYNPASDIELPRLEHRLPKFVLTASEAEQVINQPNVNEPLGIRDRAILETFYSTGIRRMEMIGLRPYDLDVERGMLIVRQGKGKKDRVIPIGDRAVAWIERYLVEVRPGLLVGDRAGDALFLTNRGSPFSPDQMTQLVAGIRQRRRHRQEGAVPPVPAHDGDADAGKRGRHPLHSSHAGPRPLETTQIYTQVSIRKLKEIHTATHPARKERSP